MSKRGYFISLGLVLGLVLCLSACMSGKDDDEALLAAVYNYLSANPLAVVSPSGTWGDDEAKLPLEILTSNQSEAKMRESHPTLFVLADAGLLTISRKNIETTNVFGKAEKLPGLHIELTEEGAKWYQPESGMLRFAKEKTDAILEKREISPEQLQVKVRLKLLDIAPWASKPEIQAAFPRLAEIMRQDSIEYSLTYDGKAWQVNASGASGDLTQ